jgi:hypothetical protein
MCATITAAPRSKPSSGGEGPDDRRRVLRAPTLIGLGDGPEAIGEGVQAHPAAVWAQLGPIVSQVSVAPPPRRRRKRVALIALGVIVFLAISGLLARFLTVENLERDGDLALIQAEARGDAAGMIARLVGCRSSPACVAEVHRILANPRVHRPGSVKILNLESHTAYSLTGSKGSSRVAWTVIGTLPVVQCVEVRRTGNFLTGIDVSLLRISPPIPNEGEC